MRFTAILGQELWRPAHESLGYVDRLWSKLVRSARKLAPSRADLASAMGSLEAQDPLLLAEWLRAEDRIGRGTSGNLGEGDRC